jgi:hypothetical protein
MVACLELGGAAQLAGAAVRVHDKADDRIRPETLEGRHGFWSVVSHVPDGAGRAVASFVPVVEGVGGGVPKFEPSPRAMELRIVLVQAQMFGPELEPEPVG